MLLQLHTCIYTASAWASLLCCFHLLVFTAAFGQATNDQTKVPTIAAMEQAEQSIVLRAKEWEAKKSEIVKQTEELNQQVENLNRLNEERSKLATQLAELNTEIAAHTKRLTDLKEAPSFAKDVVKLNELNTTFATAMQNGERLKAKATALIDQAEKLKQQVIDLTVYVESLRLGIVEREFNVVAVPLLENASTKDKKFSAKGKTIEAASRLALRACASANLGRCKVLSAEETPESIKGRNDERLKQESLLQLAEIDFKAIADELRPLKSSITNFNKEMGRHRDNLNSQQEKIAQFIDLKAEISRQIVDAKARYADADKKAEELNQTIAGTTKDINKKRNDAQKATQQATDLETLISKEKDKAAAPKAALERHIKSMEAKASTEGGLAGKAAAEKRLLELAIEPARQLGKDAGKEFNRQLQEARAYQESFGTEWKNDPDASNIGEDLRAEAQALTAGLLEKEMAHITPATLVPKARDSLLSQLTNDAKTYDMITNEWVSSERPTGSRQILTADDDQNDLPTLSVKSADQLNELNPDLVLASAPYKTPSEAAVPEVKVADSHFEPGAPEVKLVDPDQDIIRRYTANYNAAYRSSYQAVMNKENVASAAAAAFADAYQTTKASAETFEVSPASVAGRRRAQVVRLARQHYEEYTNTKLAALEQQALVLVKDSASAHARPVVVIASIENQFSGIPLTQGGGAIPGDNLAVVFRIANLSNQDLAQGDLSIAVNGSVHRKKLEETVDLPALAANSVVEFRNVAVIKVPADTRDKSKLLLNLSVRHESPDGTTSDIYKVNLDIPVLRLSGLLRLNSATLETQGNEGILRIRADVPRICMEINPKKIRVRSLQTGEIFHSDRAEWVNDNGFLYLKIPFSLTSFSGGPFAYEYALVLQQGEESAANSKPLSEEKFNAHLDLHRQIFVKLDAPNAKFEKGLGLRNGSTSVAFSLRFTIGFEADTNDYVSWRLSVSDFQDRRFAFSESGCSAQNTQVRKERQHDCNISGNFTSSADAIDKPQSFTIDFSVNGAVVQQMLIPIVEE